MKCKCCGKETEKTIKGWCECCYQRNYKYGSPEKTRKKNHAVCEVCGEPAAVLSLKLCMKHYKRRRTHGNTENTRLETWGRSEDNPLYRTWCTMRQRCNDPNSANYPYYGARGVKTCERWDDFWLFVQDMGDKPSIKHTLDRINSNGNYEPDNCRWASPSQQAQNRRSTVLTEDQAIKIRQMLDIGFSNIEIARALKVDVHNVEGIKYKDTWK